MTAMSINGEEVLVTAMSINGEEVGSATKAGHSEDQGSEESGDDDTEKSGLVPKESGKKRARKYDSKKFSSVHCNSKQSYICMLCGVIAVLLLIVVLLVAVVVVLVVTDMKQEGVITTDDSNESAAIGEASDTELGGEEVPWGSIRLQSSVVPEAYNIDLTLDMDSFQVSGEARIACSVISRVDFIALHAVDMTITEHILEGGEGEIVEHQTVLYPENDFFIFDLAKPLDPGPVVAVLHFNYMLRDDLDGFYRSFYKDANGNAQYLAATQFEPTDARKAFPCFDEPSFKANFTITITHQACYEAWSNMPALSRTADIGSGMVTTQFETSLKMSSYLVAFIVSDFKCIKDTMTSISGKEIVVSIHNYVTCVVHA